MFPLLAALALTIPKGMAPIPAGSYRPLYAMTTGARTSVSAFAIDREPVTRGEFLRFVRANRSWRKSAIRPELAENTYLSDWRGDLDAGDATALSEPARNVSWFAAQAYCKAAGKRLPTTDEWEYVAAASETKRDATSDASFIRRLLTIYTSHTGGFRNVYGVSDLHGGLWEWTDDFNPSHTHEHAHPHDLNCAGAALGASDHPTIRRSCVPRCVPRSATAMRRNTSAFVVPPADHHRSMEDSLVAFPFPLAPVDPRRSINELLQDYPAALPVLNARGIDTCCGGDESLAAAAAALGLDVTVLANEIAASLGEAPAVKTCKCGCQHPRSS